jgi:hypothetical protein
VLQKWLMRQCLMSLTSGILNTRMMTSAIASSYCRVIVGSSISDAEHDIEAAELQLQIAR